MPVNHVVQQGEHVSSIASQFGFTDFSIIWDHADNADLKQLRVNPNVLLPGDTLVIPDRETKEEAGATTRRHTFRLAKKELYLRLILEDAYEKPVANTPCDLFLEGTRSTVTTDGSGKIEQRIAADTANATLTIKGVETPFQNDLLSITVGALDPLNTLTGQSARLTNLGYFAGAPESEDDLQFQSALQEFQCDGKLAVDGKPGRKTQAKLKQMHGC